MAHYNTVWTNRRMFSARHELNPDNTFVVLCLQGGGARAAVQVGVYEALSKWGLEPDWVIGISSGALNAAVIASHPTPQQRLDKLAELWRILESPWRLASIGQQSPRLQQQSNELEALLSLFGKPGFYWPRPENPLFSSGGRSFYQQSALARTVERVIDFSRLNAFPNRGALRLSVGCSDVERGITRFFDNDREILLDADDLHVRGRKVEKEIRRRSRLKAPPTGQTTTFTTQHLLAAAAYPPGSDYQKIDGAHYWDAGVLDNSPLDALIEGFVRAPPDQKVIVVLVDLWSRESALPRDVLAASWRRLEMQHASRISSDVERFILRLMRGKLEVKAEVLHITYESPGASPLDPLDFSTRSIGDRRQWGFKQTETAIERWQARARKPPRKMAVEPPCLVCHHRFANGEPVGRAEWRWRGA